MRLVPRASGYQCTSSTCTSRRLCLVSSCFIEARKKSRYVSYLAPSSLASGASDSDMNSDQPNATAPSVCAVGSIFTISAAVASVRFTISA